MLDRENEKTPFRVGVLSYFGASLFFRVTSLYKTCIVLASTFPLKTKNALLPLTCKPA